MWKDKTSFWMKSFVTDVCTDCISSTQLGHGQFAFFYSNVWRKMNKNLCRSMLWHDFQKAKSLTSQICRCWSKMTAPTVLLGGKHLKQGECLCVCQRDLDLHLKHSQVNLFGDSKGIRSDTEKQKQGALQGCQCGQSLLDWTRWIFTSPPQP